MDSPACSTSGRGTSLLLRVVLCALAAAHAVRASAQAPLLADGEQFADRGCTPSQFYNGTTGQCECLEGLQIIQCEGPDKGKCGRFNASTQCAEVVMFAPPLTAAEITADPNATDASALGPRAGGQEVDTGTVDSLARGESLGPAPDRSRTAACLHGDAALPLAALLLFCARLALA